MDFLHEVIKKATAKKATPLSGAQKTKLVKAMYNALANNEKEQHKDTDVDKFLVLCQTDSTWTEDKTCETYVVGINAFLDPYQAYKFAMNFEKKYPAAKGNSKIMKLSAQKYRELIIVLKATVAIMAHGFSLR